MNSIQQPSMLYMVHIGLLVGRQNDAEVAEVIGVEASCPDEEGEL